MRSSGAALFWFSFFLPRVGRGRWGSSGWRVNTAGLLVVAPLGWMASNCVQSYVLLVWRCVAAAAPVLAAPLCTVVGCFTCAVSDLRRIRDHPILTSTRTGSCTASSYRVCALMVIWQTRRPVLPELSSSHKMRPNTHCYHTRGCLTGRNHRKKKRGRAGEASAPQPIATHSTEHGRSTAGSRGGSP